MFQKIVKLPVLFLASTFVLGACSTEGSEEQSDSSEAVEQQETSNEWKTEVQNIVETEDSKTTQLDRVYLYANDYSPQENQADIFFNDLVSEYESGNFEENILDPLQAATVQFKSEVAMNVFEESNKPHKVSFLQDLSQVNKYVYREVDTFDSEDTLSNLEQIEESLSEID